MSWATCYSGSNNIHFGSPPIMTDGRNYSNWQPGTAINESIIKHNNIKSNWEYRQFLQNNGNKIMESNQLDSCQQHQSNGQNIIMSNTPYLYKSCIDSSHPYGYESSDLKNLYLSRQELQSRMSVPDMSQYKLIKKLNAN